ncbi:hypothetical protein SEPCBS57363_006423 [Sporothrix epigloea]|uniref:Uncharacterized protein n=1 Tax=Sporothrix epigloea TaxID=1892477 RepID=A0ABP0E2Y7_9PEZI
MDAPVLAPPPTATTTVHFPRREWTTLDSKWSLVLTATVELFWDPVDSLADASDGASVFRSQRVAAARVADLVRAGRLWIGTGGRHVDLAVRPTLAGRAVAVGKAGELFRAKLEHVLLHWPVWSDELGLRVFQSSREKLIRTDGKDSSVIHLAVSQPPSPHGLYAPRSDGGIPQARLDHVACQIDLQLDETGSRSPKSSLPKQTSQRHPAMQPTNRKRTRSKKTTETTAKKSALKTKRPAKAKTKADLSRKTLPSMLVPANGRQSQKQLDRGAVKLRKLLVEDSVAWHKATLLVEMALHMLVGTAKGGSKRLVAGVRPMDSVSMPGGAPGLLNIAPAVWSSDYFTAVSSRALHLSLIHRCLESFVNAQSPSLRRKAVALTGAPHDSSTPKEMLLGSKLEEVLLRGVLQLPTRVKRSLPRLQRSSRPKLLPPSPKPEAQSSQESVDSLVHASLLDETDDSHLIDLSFDNLEAVFSLTPANSQSLDESFEGLEADLSDTDVLDARELAWGEIDAWSDPDGYFDDDKQLFEEIDGTWSPADCDYNVFRGEEDELQLAEDDDPYGDVLLDESSIAPWQEMQAEELSQWQDSDDQGMSLEEYLDDEDLEFVDVDEMDFDEFVSLWQNEDMIQERY